MAYLAYINVFRALAIFVVVALHTMLAFSWTDNPNQQKILHIVYGNGTILFVFIAGYLFQHLSYKFDTKKYYLSKLKFVLLPYFVISLPVVLYDVLVSHPGTMSADFLAQPAWLQFLNYYWWGAHSYPMWFMPVIAIFYFVGPLLIKGDRNNILYLLLPIFIWASFIVHRSLYPTNNFVHFFSIYVLGMFLSKHKNVINPQLMQNKVLIALLVSFLLICIWQYFPLTPQLKAPFYIQKIIFTFLALGLLIKFEAYTKHTVVNIIANTSFGVYFVHAYIIEAIKMLFIYMNQHFLSHSRISFQGNIAFHFLLSCLILLLSILLVMLIKGMMGNKTYILIGHSPPLKTVT